MTFVIGEAPGLTWWHVVPNSCGGWGGTRATVSATSIIQVISVRLKDVLEIAKVAWLLSERSRVEPDSQPWLTVWWSSYHARTFQTVSRKAYPHEMMYQSREWATVLFESDLWEAFSGCGLNSWEAAIGDTQPLLGFNVSVVLF